LSIHGKEEVVGSIPAGSSITVKR